MPLVKSASGEPNKEAILEMSRRVGGGAKISQDEENQFLDVFEAYECWVPFFKILSQRLKAKSGAVRENFVRLARVQSLYLEDVFAAAETCAQMVKALSIPFSVFLHEILPGIIEKDDFASEAAILQAVSTEFSSTKDKSECLERLCMLFEKKTYNENQLTASYEKLLELDRKNVRALKYFKLVFTQSQDWENVARLLQDLMRAVKHQQERFRVAQELATVLLYQLDLPEEAIRIIDTYCQGSPLDTSNIQYEAYQRLKNYQGCVNILGARLKKESDVANQAILYYKIGEMQAMMDKKKEAIANFERAAILWPDFLEPVERAVHIAAKERDWPKVVHWLGELKARVKLDESSSRIAEALNRITSGLEKRA